jgi:hypothetical protein
VDFGIEEDEVASGADAIAVVAGGDTKGAPEFITVGGPFVMTPFKGGSIDEPAAIVAAAGGNGVNVVCDTTTEGADNEGGTAVAIDGARLDVSLAAAVVFAVATEAAGTAVTGSSLIRLASRTSASSSALLYESLEMQR